MFVRGQPGNPLTSGTKISSAKNSVQHGKCKKEAELVGEGKVNVGQRGERPRGSSLWKISRVGAKGTKLKETAWEAVASMINMFVFAHQNIKRE